MAPVRSVPVHLRAHRAGVGPFEEHNRIVDVYRIATPEVVGYVGGWRTGEAESLPKTSACQPFNKVKWFLEDDYDRTLLVEWRRKAV